MYLLYLDDSGSARNASEENFVLGGFIVHETKLYWINRHLEDLAKSVNSEYPRSVELHASAIYSGKTAPWKQMLREERKGMINAVLNVAKRESKNVSILSCVVHKSSFPGHDPVELAFENLCSRFDLFLGRKYKETNESTNGLIILDESSHETSLQDLAINFRTIGTKWKVINNIQEVPLFVNSKASRGIQLADHIAYSVFRRYEAGDLNYFNIIQGVFDSEGERMHGLVHKTNATDCTCPACVTRRLSTSI